MPVTWTQQGGVWGKLLWEVITNQETYSFLWSLEQLLIYPGKARGRGEKGEKWVSLPHEGLASWARNLRDTVDQENKTHLAISRPVHSFLNNYRETLYG